MNAVKSGGKDRPAPMRVVKDLVVNDARDVKGGGTDKSVTLSGSQCLVFFLGG